MCFLVLFIAPTQRTPRGLCVQVCLLPKVVKALTTLSCQSSNNQSLSFLRGNSAAVLTWWGGFACLSFSPVALLALPLPPLDLPPS